MRNILFLLLPCTLVSSSSSSSSNKETCPFQDELPCTVVFGVVNFDFDNLTHWYSPTTLVFRTTNVVTNMTENHPVSKHYNTTGTVYFKVWDVDEVERDSNYKLALVKTGEPEQVLWRYDGIFKVHRDLFYCYYNIRNKYHNPFNPRPRVFDINTNGTSLGVQWSTNHWDEEYNFLDYHEVSVLHRGQQVYRKRQEQSTTCNDKLCRSMPITGLQPCQHYTLCVHTKFHLSTCVANQCVNVTTPACHFRRPKTNYIVAGMAGGVFLLAVVMGVVVCWRLKRGIPGTKMSRDSDLEVDEFIQPRDCLYQEIPYGLKPEHLYRQILVL